LKFKIGCCGFPTSKDKYYNSFSVVEVNATFYKYPNPNLLIKWRSEAPSNFEFTVKANQDISHKYSLKPITETIEAYSHMVKICEILNSKILLIQTPASFRPSDEVFIRIQKFFEKIRKNNVKIAWETRGSDWDDQNVRDKLQAVLKRLDITHVTDPFKAMPAYSSDFVYFRLHGLGERMYYYQFTDEELMKLADVIKNLRNSNEVYIFFNNLSMFEDAIRFQKYVAEGKLPPLTSSFGLEAFSEIVEKTRYPTTKSKLMKTLGWKLLYITPGKQATVSKILEKIPTKIFKEAKDVIDEAKKYLS
jgi:uncharacterized protein YecE (DUF72 family)